MQDRIFYSICFGFVTGVLLRSFLFVNFYFAIFLAVIASVLIFFFFLISENKWGIVAGIFILAFCLGIFRFHIADKPVPEISGAEVAQKVSLEGVIIDAPDIRENNQKLIERLAHFHYHGDKEVLLKDLEQFKQKLVAEHS